jgi:hypothetical protein
VWRFYDVFEKSVGVDFGIVVRLVGHSFGHV